MKIDRCGMESPILELSRAGQLTEAAQEHLATCSTCADALQVDRFLNADAARIPDLESLPDPTVVWWRARQRARIRQVERATLPIQFTERLTLILGAVALAIGLSLTWPMLRGAITHWSSSWARGLVQALPLNSSSLILTLFCSLFLLVGFGLYSQWAET